MNLLIIEMTLGQMNAQFCLFCAQLVGVLLSSLTTFVLCKAGDTLPSCEVKSSFIHCALFKQDKFQPTQNLIT